MLIGDNGMGLKGDGRGGLELVDLRDRKVSAMAAEELRYVAKFLDKNAEAIGSQPSDNPDCWKGDVNLIRTDNLRISNRARKFVVRA